MEFDLTCSIVLYKNDPEILKQAIVSFLATDLNVKLFLIDNSPTDDLVGMVNDDRIEYFHNPSNPGFGAAHNIAIKKFIKISKFHLILNPDVSFKVGVLEEIIHFMFQDEMIGLLMPKVLYPDGKIQYLCKLLPTPYDWIGRRFNPINSVIEKRNEEFELKFTGYSKIMNVPYLSGCFMFIRLAALKNVGFFDERIFMYGEDADLCRRLFEFGYKNIYFPNVSIVHAFQKGSHKSFRLTWVGIKSAIYYFNKWGWFIDNKRDLINASVIIKNSN